MSQDEKEKDDLEITPDEIQDLDLPEEEGEEVRGGRPPVVGTQGCTGPADCLNE